MNESQDIIFLNQAAVTYRFLPPRYVRQSDFQKDAG